MYLFYFDISCLKYSTTPYVANPTFEGHHLNILQLVNKM
jgi:hypothetical protein